MPDIKYPEFVAATLPSPQQWEGKQIWREDLKTFQFSTGLAWQDVGAVSGAGKRNAAAIIVSGDSRAALAQQPAGSGTAWARSIRNVFRGADGLVYVIATAAHGLPSGAYPYIWNVGKSNFEFNNQQFRAVTLSSVPADVAAYVAADGGTATTANTFVLADTPVGGVNTLAADAGQYTIEMAFGMGGAFSYANAYAGHRFKKVISIAKGGAKLADWLLDIDAIIAHPLLPKFSYADILTNDWDPLADSQSAVDTLIGQYKAGIARILAANMRHVVPNLIPVVSMTATQIKNLGRINRAIESEIWTMDGVIASNHYNQILDASNLSAGLGKSAYFYPDNYHTKGSGNVREGKVDADAINTAVPLVRPAPQSSPSTKNALTNPWMTTAGSGTASTAGSAAAPSSNAGVPASWILGAYRGGSLSGVDFSTILPWQQDSTPSAWPANTAVAQWKTVYPTAANGYCYVASAITGTNKTHATTEPTWPTTLFGTVVDNEVTWMCVPYLNNGSSAKAAGLRVIGGGGLPNNSFVRLSQTAIALSGLSGDNLIAVGDQVQGTALVQVFKPTGSNLGIQGVSLSVRGSATIDGNFAAGRDLAKSDFLSETGDIGIWPVEWQLETHPDFRLLGAQTAMDYLAEFVMGPGAELIALVSQPSLHKSPA